MVKKKIYYRHVGEYSQGQGYLREFRVDMTLSHVRRRERKREGKEMPQRE